MKRSLIGVNLGGWLILEKWLTPSVFAGLNVEDEWGLSQTAVGRQRIETHRRSFLKEEDFAWLHDRGVTFVRLPVPYWAVIESEDYVSAHSEVAWAMQMAEKYNIQVLLDLHAAPGGQNVGDHSGKKGEMEWFSSHDNQDRTIEILKLLARQYRDSPMLWGIELLNEPERKGHYFQLVHFYRSAYRELCGVVRPGTKIVFHDGFQPLLFTGSVWPRRDYPVVMDVHWYGFPLNYANTFTRYLKDSKILRILMTKCVQLWQPIIVGEWSSVLPQRFFDELPKEQHEALLKKNSQMQMDVYKRAAGNMYWNYKAEGDGMWNFRSLVENGVISLE